jgi:hypothetical protein
MQDDPMTLADATSSAWSTNRGNQFGEGYAAATSKGPNLSRGGCDTGNSRCREIEYDDRSHEISRSKVLGCVEEHVDNGIACSCAIKQRWNIPDGVNPVYMLVERHSRHGLNVHGHEGEKSKKNIGGVSSK